MDEVGGLFGSTRRPAGTYQEVRAASGELTVIEKVHAKQSTGRIEVLRPGRQPGDRTPDLSVTGTGGQDAHTRALAVRAGERLASAGLRAYGRFDVAAAAQALSRMATARFLTTREDRDTAVRLAHEAVHMVPPAMLTLRAELRLDLAEILMAAGRHQAAMPVLDEAAGLHERKGMLVGARRARTLEASISGPTQM